MDGHHPTDMKKEKYYSDYPTVPIGGGNPYYCCASCGRSAPQINGSLDGHNDNCEWVIAKKIEIENKDETNKNRK
jgi:hypothetical protein